jgi:hypothetical protein
VSLALLVSLTHSSRGALEPIGRQNGRGQGFLHYADAADNGVTNGGASASRPIVDLATCVSEGIPYP